MDKAEKQYINVLFDEKLLSRVDDFRFKNRIASRTEAIRWLLKAALDSKLTPRGEAGPLEATPVKQLAKRARTKRKIGLESDGSKVE